jgi:hypothetical protein
VFAAIVVAVVLAAVAGAFHSPPALTPAQLAAQAAARRARILLAKETRDAHQAQQLVDVVLPTRRGSLAPAIPARLFTTPLRRHQVVGFVPYYGLGDLTDADYTDATVLVYSSLCVAGDGTIASAGQDCANGLDELAGAAFGDLVAQAHAAGDRVLLSVESTDSTTIAQLVAHRSTTSRRLAAALSSLVVAHDLNGVDIDLEGRERADRAAFVGFVGDLAADLRVEIPAGEIMLNAYPQSAAGASDFFDVARLAKIVDEIFVMAYQMENPAQSSANSPLTSPTLGWSDVQALVQYTQVVPADKIILGLPFYGLNFTTTNAKPGAAATTPAPSARVYSAIAAVGHTAYWDLASQTPYSSFRYEGSFHQDWYDDPVSLALKTALASRFHIAGVGAWAFGMEGTNSDMLTALTGDSPVVKLPVTSATG